MQKEIDDFIKYLHTVKKTSNNTEISYRRDLLKMVQFLEEQGVESMEKVSKENLNSYMIFLETQKFAAATISRNVASIKAYFNYLVKQKKIPINFAKDIKAPKIDKKMPDILSVEDVVKLLEEPKRDNPKEIRDRAMLELLYATGIRVTELLTLKTSDINLELNYIVCKDKDKERVIPFGEVAKAALQKYLIESREELLGANENDILFVNCSGKPMSRQGFWKLLKHYASKAGLRTEITPHTLRHSFAAHLVGNGADLKSVQEMMGHSDISTTQVYMMVNANKVRNVYQKAHPRC